MPWRTAPAPRVSGSLLRLPLADTGLVCVPNRSPPNQQFEPNALLVQAAFGSKNSEAGHYRFLLSAQPNIQNVSGSHTYVRRHKLTLTRRVFISRIQVKFEFLGDRTLTDDST